MTDFYLVRALYLTGNLSKGDLLALVPAQLRPEQAEMILKENHNRV